ncbi:MAG: FAD-dependent oxidoreductase, partial [Chloroflexota bacterium]
SLRAGKVLQTRAFQNPKISFIWNTVVTAVNGSEKLTTLTIKNLQTNVISEHKTDGLFIFIGHTPNTQMFQGQLDMNDEGVIKTNSHMETNVPGVFVAGEVADSHFRQVITSAGMGAAAAIQVTHFLEKESAVIS